MTLFKRYSRFVVTFVSIVCATLAQGSPVSISYEIVDKDQSSAVIAVTTDLNDLKIKATKVGTQIFSTIYWEDESHTAALGSPDLPRINRWIAVPNDSAYKIQVQRLGARRISNVTLMPRQPDSIDDGRKVPFTFDADAYRKPAGIPTVRFGENTPAAIGSVPIKLLSVSPFAYDPSTRLLIVYEKIVIKLTPESGLNLGNFTAHTLSTYQDKMLKTLAINGTYIDTAKRSGGENSVLIVTTEDLEPEASRLRGLHPDKNFAVKIVTSATTAEQIKGEIAAAYRQTNLEAVIIVGDETKVKYFTWNGLPSDSWYAYISGNDSLADIGLGRIPAANVAEAKLLIDKISSFLAAQKNGYSTKKIMLAAHAEEYPGKYTANMESVRKGSNPLGLSFNLQYGGKDSTNDSVLARLNDGYAILTYRGHGSAATWSGWGRDGKSFGPAQVSSMENSGSGLTMIFNIACDTGAFHLATRSQSENMVLLEPIAKFENAPPVHRGAIAVLAATKPSYTEINHRFAINLFASIQANPEATIGEISILANNKLITDANGSMNDNTRMYLLFGDPLLKPSIPRR